MQNMIEKVQAIVSDSELLELRDLVQCINIFWGEPEERGI